MWSSLRSSLLTGGRKFSGAFPRMWKAYVDVLDKRPLPTQLATGLVVCSAGDALAQLVIEKHDKYDWHRCAFNAFWGLAYGGYFQHHWYKFLDTRYPVGGGNRVLMKKIAVDQSIEPLTFPGYFVISGFWEGHSWDWCKEKLKEEYWDTLVADYCVWFPTQVLNFTLVPPSQRVLFTCLVMVGWNCFLSYTAHTEQEELKKISSHEKDEALHSSESPQKGPPALPQGGPVSSKS
eukprot:GILI01024391.1.p1 GENE.GILI01024391.1~~GILI01024391.1.p1  ORF type:complete len:268 (+),score=55.02 GILI01024391.1:103-804(+)